MTTNKITDLTQFKKEKIEATTFIWQCHCGNKTFIIYTEGEIQCSVCDTYSVELKAYEVEEES